MFFSLVLPEQHCQGTKKMTSNGTVNNAGLAVCCLLVFLHMKNKMK
jgi:hypothetical protein